MKGLVLIPVALMIALTTGCAATDKISDELHIFGGHHNELKHRINKAEDTAAHAQADAAAAQADAAAAQADAAAAKADAAHAQATAEAAKRMAQQALDKYSRK
jgi:septal ring factor EnvC (AmiA/AmiB activator)